MTPEEIFGITPLQSVLFKIRYLNGQIERYKEAECWYASLYIKHQEEQWLPEMYLKAVRKHLSTLENRKKFLIKRKLFLRAEENGTPLPYAQQEYDITYIKQNTQIENILGTPVKTHINKKWYKCPYHNEKSASFVWNEDKKYFYCFGCGKSGDILELYQHVNKCSFVDMLKSLS